MVLGVHLPGVATAATTAIGIGVHGDYGQSKDADSGSPLAGAGAEFGLGAKSESSGEVRYESIDPDKDFGNAVDDAEVLSFDEWSVRTGLTFFLK